jgi:hypothetical protein
LHHDSKLKFSWCFLLPLFPAESLEDTPSMNDFYLFLGDTMTGYQQNWYVKEVNKRHVFLDLTNKQYDPFELKLAGHVHYHSNNNKVCDPLKHDFHKVIYKWFFSHCRSKLPIVFSSVLAYCYHNCLLMIIFGHILITLQNLTNQVPSYKGCEFSAKLSLCVC